MRFFGIAKASRSKKCNKAFLISKKCKLRLVLKQHHTVRCDMSVSFPGLIPGLLRPATSLTACARVFAFGVLI